MTLASGEFSTVAGDAVRDNYRRQGAIAERERIIKLLEEAECQGEDDCCKTIQQAIALIKGEHKHDIDVFGAPCACGTHHEYCNNCDWVEPCEIDGENN